MRNVQIFSVNDFRAVNIAKATIESGGVLSFPTDTVYALSCDATNSTAVAKVVQCKGREGNKPFPLFVASLEAAMRIAKFDRRLMDVARRFWPGALTIVAPVKDDAKIANECVSADGTIALRVPDHVFDKALLQVLDVPIVATSANVAGESPATAPKEVIEKLGDKIDLLIADYDVIYTPVPSTIVKIVDDNLKILRNGAINERDIFRAAR